MPGRKPEREAGVALQTAGQRLNEVVIGVVIAEEDLVGWRIGHRHCSTRKNWRHSFGVNVRPARRFASANITSIVG
jgi:hypothetical protein